MSLIECVPNVSEGRRSTVVDMLAGEIRTVPGVRLLDYSADPSHNRSVFTMAGDRSALKTAVLAMAWGAVHTIDLRTHRGEHPRIGAVDVVPFIPLGGTTMAECVELAREVGQAIAERLNVPVYLYEEAASRDGRRRLEDIRRGQFEGLSSKMTRAGVGAGLRSRCASSNSRGDRRGRSTSTHRVQCESRNRSPRDRQADRRSGSSKQRRVA